MLRPAVIGALCATAAWAIVPANAAEFEVHMLNKGADKQAMVFEPAFLKIAPGDTVRFIPTDKGHDVESLADMIPAGAAPFKGKVNAEVTVTFDVPGLYGYRCIPHFGMGMVGLVEVGDGAAAVEAARAVKMPPLARKRMATYLDQVGK